MRVGVITFPGSLDERDAQRAVVTYKTGDLLLTLGVGFGLLVALLAVALVQARQYALLREAMRRVAAAGQHFSRYGYEKTTVSDLADAKGHLVLPRSLSNAELLALAQGWARDEARGDGVRAIGAVVIALGSTYAALISNDDELAAERERATQLEQENRELRRANEILRRASAFFAAELDRPSK